MFLMCGLVCVLAGCSAHGVRHVVLPGQTLYRISKTYDVPIKEISRYNHISDPTQIKAGESLWIPGAEQIRTVTIVPPQQPVTRTPAPAKSVPVKSKAIKNTHTASAIKPASQTSKRFPSDRRSKFSWPVKGTVVKKFKSGTKKGIEIGVAVGTPVRSAAAGQVIYSSNDISGFGYLLIVKHRSDVYSVYGYNTKSLVRAGDFVGQGDKIALSGAPPGDRHGRLHFEIREGKNDVNPMLYLH